MCRLNQKGNETTDPEARRLVVQYQEPGDRLVHQPDHRRLGGKVAQPFGILLQRLCGCRGGVLGLQGGIQAIEGRLELDRQGHFNLNGEASGCGDGAGVKASSGSATANVSTSPSRATGGRAPDAGSGPSGSPAG